MIRITGGTLRGKKLAPHGSWVRPTSTYRREMIFNILQHRYFTDPSFLKNKRVADIFAGTGALGLEALSRGVAHVTFVEAQTETLKNLASFIKKHHLEKQVTTLLASSPDLPACQTPFDLLFLDPPYGKNLIPITLEALKTKGWCHGQSLLVGEVDRRETLPLPPWITIDLLRRQGRTEVYFFKVHEEK